STSFGFGGAAAKSVVIETKQRAKTVRIRCIEASIMRQVRASGATPGTFFTTCLSNSGEARIGFNKGVRSIHVSFASRSGACGVRGRTCDYFRRFGPDQNWCGEFSESDPRHG